MRTPTAAWKALLRAWPAVVRETRLVLGSELHYQAMIYHCLRTAGRVPIRQLGMNVKQFIARPSTAYGKGHLERRHPNYQGFEPIPDICIFHPSVRGDWRRRKNMETLRALMMAIEVKASERSGSRLSGREIRHDLDKLVAHWNESMVRNARYGRGNFLPIMIIVDTAPDTEERMAQRSIQSVCDHAIKAEIPVFYVSQSDSWHTDWR